MIDSGQIDGRGCLWKTQIPSKNIGQRLVVSTSSKVLPMEFSKGPLFGLSYPKTSKLNDTVESHIWSWIRCQFEDVLHLENIATMVIIRDARKLQWVSKKWRFLICTSKVNVVF